MSDRPARPFSTAGTWLAAVATVAAEALFLWVRGHPPAASGSLNFPPPSAVPVAAGAFALACLLGTGFSVRMETLKVWPPIWLRTLLALAVAVGALGLVEGAIRLAVAAHPPLWRPDGTVRWYPTAYFKGRWPPPDGPYVETNRMGLKSPDIPLEKPPGVRRVLILGDSSTWGSGSEVQNTYPAQLEALIRAYRRPQDPRVQVIDAGIEGYSSAQGRALLPRLVAAYHPDILLFGFNNDQTDLNGTFDADYYRVGAFTREARELLYRSDLFLLLRRYLGSAAGLPIPDDFPRREPGAFLPRVPVPDHRANYERMLEVAQRRGMRGGVLILPIPHAPGYDESDRALARERHALLVDFNEMWRRTRLPRRLLLRDGVHPTSAGYRLMARLLFEALVRRGWVAARLPTHWPGAYAYPAAVRPIPPPRRRPGSGRRRRRNTPHGRPGRSPG